MSGREREQKEGREAEGTGERHNVWGVRSRGRDCRVAHLAYNKELVYLGTIIIYLM